jgi:hypothetical protein
MPTSIINDKYVKPSRKFGDVIPTQVAQWPHLNQITGTGGWSAMQNIELSGDIGHAHF